MQKNEIKNTYSNYIISSLTEITLPDTLLYIEEAAFAECNNLKRINYEGTLSSWCGVGFNFYAGSPEPPIYDLYIGGEQIEDVILPEGITKIAKGAFAGAQIKLLQLITRLRVINSLQGLLSRKGLNGSVVFRIV